MNSFPAQVSQTKTQHLHLCCPGSHVFDDAQLTQLPLEGPASVQSSCVSWGEPSPPVFSAQVSLSTPQQDPLQTTPGGTVQPKVSGLTEMMDFHPL